MPPAADEMNGTAIAAQARDSFRPGVRVANPGTPMPYDTVGAVITSASSITPEMVRNGERLFHGRGDGASGCSFCHGQGGRGAIAGPELISGNFRNVTGKYQTIIDVVTIGVAKPKQFVGTIMPPMGGVKMSPEEIRDVAAYVYMLAPADRRLAD